ncbi:MAG TPA: tetratricopeptide repeat protein, partial [Thermoanaerobaculia bacterium]|nr:tetratricopeptide repeat protein [Thermoanaerobaculia bacterium]
MALFGTPPTPPSRLEELKRILQRDPTSRQFLALAEEYRRQGKVRDAIITLERGLSIHTSSVAAHVSLGKAYQQLDRWEDAIRSYQNALRYDRENLVAIRQIAEVYMARGDKLEALKKLKLYRGLKAGDREVHDLIARLETELEPPPPERFPSGIRPLEADLLARTRAAQRPAPAGEAPPPFEVPSEPVWPPSEPAGGSAAAFSPAPEPPPAEALGERPSWEAGGEVFPAAAPAAGEELSEPEVPTRVSSTPEVAAFLETELAPPSGDETAALPVEPFTVVVTPAPERTTAAEPPSESVSPAPAPMDSGIRRGLALRERYEAPSPIEMTAEETPGPPPPPSEAFEPEPAPAP